MALLGPDEERVLIDRLGRKKTPALRFLYERMHSYVRGVCSRYVADDDAISDLVQNTFIKVFSSFDKFKYRGAGSLQAWIRQIAVHESIDYLRACKKSREVPLDDNMDMPDDEGADIEMIPSEELFAMVRKLPDQYRTVFNLYVFEDKSHKEIASMLGIGEKTSASDLFRARKLLAAMMKKYLSDN